MTEEIIINGVNVAGCEYMLNNKIKGKQHCPAKAMPYAKETSCICRKSIDTPYNFCKHNPNCHYKQLKRLEQENNAYKQSEQEAIEIIKELKEYSQRMENQRENYYKEYKKYRSALEEIKIIADDTFKVCDDDCGNARKIKLIIDKINEVLDESN